MQLWRGNSYTDIIGAPNDFLYRLGRYLAVRVEWTDKPQKQSRFGRVFTHEGEPWGSLLLGTKVPAGLTGHVLRIAQHEGIEVDYRDERRMPEDKFPWWSLSTPLRTYQKQAVDLLIRHGCGVVNSPPRSGKTTMAMSAIDRLAQPALYIAPSVAIVKQTYETMVGVFGSDFVARLDGEAKPHERDIEKQIVVATPASVVKQSADWFKTRGLLILDEFHHAAAETYHRINALCESVFYRLCLTGTHFRTSDDSLAMEAICSDLLVEVSVPDLVQHGYLVPARVVSAPMFGKGIQSGNWQEVYREGIVKHDQRNSTVIHIARTCIENNLPTIVLVKQRAHADSLGAEIPDCAVVKGGESALTGASIEAFKRGELACLVGTTVIGEGVDLPNAASLVYASGGTGSVAMVQSYFRPLTPSPGKQVGVVYDFHDRHHATLRSHSEQRIKAAEEYLGCVVRL